LEYSNTLDTDRTETGRIEPHKAESRRGVTRLTEQRLDPCFFRVIRVRQLPQFRLR